VNNIGFGDFRWNDNVDTYSATYLTSATIAYESELTVNSTVGIKKGDYVNVTMRPYKVSTIVIDKMMKSKGYGTLMYSIVINEMGCLFSDVLLYPEALNMWVNVLPKYYNVGFIDDFGRKKELKGKNRYPKPNEVRHYFACKR
jgi:hypothetical protein